MGGALVAALAVMITSAPAVAGTINVPADQPTIQAGIDAAVDGDEVVVAPGCPWQKLRPPILSQDC